jgi:hypothetical protein
LRAVTTDDYIVRTLSLPSKFGLISKAYVSQDSSINVNYRTDILATQNPNALSLYVLSKDSNGNLSIPDPALKNNVKTYLAEFRMLTEAVNIKEAFIINGEFDVLLTKL